VPILLDFTVKSSALLVVAGLLTLLMRRASAASRHAVWMGCFVGVAALPLAVRVLPALPVPVLATQPAVAVAQDLRPLAPAVFVPARPLPMATVTVTAPPSTKVESSWSLAGVVVAAWLAGVVLALVRMVAGAAGVRRLSQRARLVTAPAIVDSINRAREAVGVRRRVRLLATDDDVMPMTWGVFRPTILVPAAFDGATTTARPLNAVIVHEVAHIARFDVVAQALTQLVTAALWFHPGVWMAQRAARLERERACDDVALRVGARPADYAMELLMLVRLFRPIRVTVPGALGAARRSQLDRRIRDILDRRVSRRGASLASVVFAAALVTGAAPVAAMRLTTRHVAAPSPVPSVVREALPVLRIVPVVTKREPEQTPAVPEISQAEVPWHAERAGMYQQVIEVSRQLVADCGVQIQIGTMAPIDVNAAHATLATLMGMSRVDAAVAGAVPAPSEQGTIRQGFKDAMHTLDVDKTKFTVGLLSVNRFDDDLVVAANVIGGSSMSVGLQALPNQGEHVVVSLVLMVGKPGSAKLPFDVKRISVLRPDIVDATPVSPRELAIDARAPGQSSLIIWGDTSRWELDVEVLPAPQAFQTALEAALAMPNDATRGDALLALARRTVFTPDMVSRFVEAVSHLSATDRDRVLAEPIHIRAGG
jgi:beta-lactamase regulating signal transducer with metallopeptidase domain